MIIDFTATWCPPCKQIGPIFVAMADEPAYKNSVKFFKCDVDQADDVSEQCNIEAMPSFVMFKGGQEIERFTGASEEALRAMVDRHK